VESIVAIRRAIPNEDGRFTYRVEKNGIHFGSIVWVNAFQPGYRFNSLVPGRRGSRTLSATPQQAARRYFRRDIPFVNTLGEKL
jgi:hypothetical protein